MPIVRQTLPGELLPAKLRSQPMGEMNTTPLIDVLLVLLVMLIFTIPMGVHSLDYPLPNGDSQVTINETTNRVTLTASNEYLWNGEKLGTSELVAVLKRAASLKPEPQLQVAPDPMASYGASAELLRLIKLSGATNVGFVGNERFRNFGT